MNSVEDLNVQIDLGSEELSYRNRSLYAHYLRNTLKDFLRSCLISVDRKAPACPHPPAPSPFLGEGELKKPQNPSPRLGGRFRVRADLGHKVGIFDLLDLSSGDDRNRVVVWFRQMHGWSLIRC
jgi:hypothetical protein